ncbi:hypothetical protein [Methylobacterium platani]|uniref:hypothetical protein n=1 Tax=Methylobacterium platani TaxID=427683 RepID=UPI0012E28022|nr:hypothetical protein [Methylobacterium platani]
MNALIVGRAKRVARDLIAIGKQIDRATTAVVLSMTSASLSYVIGSSWFEDPPRLIAVTLAGAGAGVLLNRLPRVFRQNPEQTTQELRDDFDQLEEMKKQISSNKVKEEIVNTQIEIVRKIGETARGRPHIVTIDQQKHLPPPNPDA